VSNRKRKIDRRQATFPFSEQSNNTSALEKIASRIGGNTGPKTKYYHYDVNGNIVLWGSYDLADPWWGLRYEGFPDQPVIVGRTEVMLNLFNLAKKLADSSVWVLIQGLSGTGKELIARVIASGTHGPFIPVNCDFPDGGVSFEAMMFGSEEKVLMGAPKMDGVFQLANGGTAFLDNIDCFALHLQGKLLRALQPRCQVVHRVGSSREEKVNVRIIAATNKNLRSLMEEGKFREDLYYRIGTAPLSLPPLCARKDDIPLLVVYLLLKNRPNCKRLVTKIARNTLEKLRVHNWPGNVRELETAINVALALGEGPVLQPEEFGFDSTELFNTSVCEPPSERNSTQGGNSGRQTRREEIQEYLRQNPGATTEELASVAGCCVRTVQRYLTDMRDIVRCRKLETDRRKNEYYLYGDPHGPV